MFSNYRQTQFNTCLICHENILNPFSLTCFIFKKPICIICQRKLHFMNYHTTIQNYPMTILYYYNDFFKELIFEYKARYDFVLKDVFILNVHELSKRYKDYIVVVAPHTQKQNIERGFHANKEIVKSFSKHIFLGLYKKTSHKQAELSYEKRKEIQNVIGIKGSEQLKNQKILLFDDIVTSGETLKACIKLLEKSHVQSIEVLVLATKSYFGGGKSPFLIK